MKAVLHYRAGPKLRERLMSLSTDFVQTVVVDERDDEGFAREIADAEVLFHVLRPVTDDMLALAPRLRLIQKIGVGVNTIDGARAKARGIRVANMPGTNSQAVAEHTLALMLCVLRRIVVFDAATRSGDGWTMSPAILESAGEIAGRTIGLIGCGAVPHRLVPILRALGARVIYFSRTRASGVEAEFCTLESLLRDADIVSLHVPLTTSTRRMIDSASLHLMKQGAILINTARGELIDEAALVVALRDGRLAGAGLDVFSVEPVSPDNPLFSLPNLVVSPHIAWLTPETLERSLDIAFENCRRLHENRPLVNEVIWQAER